MAKLTPLQRANYILRLMEYKWSDDALERVITELQHSIRESQKRIKNSDKRSDEFAEYVAMDESILLEAIAGTAFVVAQTYIAGVLSALEKLMADSTIASALSFSSAPKTIKRDLRRFRGKPIGSTDYTLAEGVHEFANYFKHRDDWRVEWDNPPKGNAKVTVAVIKAFGAKVGLGHDNLRAGLDGLGYKNYELTKMFLDLQSFYKEVYFHCKSTLKSAGLF
jgi:hypothetical protein